MSSEKETPARQRISRSPDRTPKQQQSQHKQETTVQDVLSLWGMWEMWCDVPPALTKRNASKKELKKKESQPWIDSVKSLGLFDTAQGFWGIHDCIVPPSKLPNGANFYLFRHNIPPMWEHEANRRGGKWVIPFNPEQATEVDKAWTDICVSLIGEQLPGPEEEICGCAVAKRRSGFKVSIWTRNAHDKGAQVNIGFFIKVLLNLKADGAIKYLEHCTMLSTVPAPKSPVMPKPVETTETSFEGREGAEPTKPEEVTPLREKATNAGPGKTAASPASQEPNSPVSANAPAPLALYSL